MPEDVHRAGCQRLADDIQFFNEPFQRPQSRVPWAVGSAAIELIPGNHGPGIAQCREGLEVAARESWSAMDHGERDAVAATETAPENPASCHGNSSFVASVHDALGQRRGSLNRLKVRPQFEQRRRFLSPSRAGFRPDRRSRS
jgi:hypothetical protein